MTTWERLVGDTERFGLRLAFTPDPENDEFEDPPARTSTATHCESAWVVPCMAW